MNDFKFVLFRPFLRERRQATVAVAFYINRPNSELLELLNVKKGFHLLTKKSTVNLSEYGKLVRANN